MKTAVRYLAPFCILALAGCGNKEDASEGNFGAAISRYLAERGDLCLGFSFRQWPVDVAAGRSPGPAAQMAVLEAAQLVSGENTVADEITPLGRTGLKAVARRYTLSDKGKRFYRPKPRPPGTVDVGSPAASDLCYGKMALASVVKWEGPVKMGALQAALVTYTYKINDLADWAMQPGIAAVFTDAARIVNGAGKVNAALHLKLTSAGWEFDGGD
jgi:hypothetical protein